MADKNRQRLLDIIESEDIEAINTFFYSKYRIYKYRNYIIRNAAFYRKHSMLDFMLKEYFVSKNSKSNKDNRFCLRYSLEDYEFSSIKLLLKKIKYTKEDLNRVIEDISNIIMLGDEIDTLKIKIINMLVKHRADDFSPLKKVITSKRILNHLNYIEYSCNKNLWYKNTIFC